jgi:hypothetical protein
VVELGILNGVGDDAVGELGVGCHYVSAREREREWGATVRELVEREERGGSGGVSANQRVGREEEEGRVLGENVCLCDHPCRY